jgi:leucine dehydrogenase
MRRLHLVMARIHQRQTPPERVCHIVTTPWTMPEFDAHEGVHFFDDRASGLRAVIAIHSTHLGPSSGGVRFWSYAQDEDAVADALRLSRAMSYKNAMAGLPVGGGKGVILRSPGQDKSPALLRAFGDAIESLGGRYVTAEDVGISEADMAVMAERTAHVSGLPVAHDAAGGDPGPLTAIGVALGIRAAVAHATGRSEVKGLRIAIQGAGSVGGGVARLLAADGAHLVIADRDSAKAEALARETGGEVVSPDVILSVDADVVSPNALGGVLDAQSIALLRAPIVAGGANNQFATPEDAALLHARGILHAPDYVINAGGIINVALAHFGLARTRGEVLASIAEIPGRLESVWAESAASDLPPLYVADARARQLIGRA